MYDETLRSVVARFESLAGSGRALARWSARIFAATFLLTDLERVDRTDPSVFDSLAGQLRDAAVCASMAPWWLPAAGLVGGYLMVRGALWSAIALAFFGAREARIGEFRRDTRALREETKSIWLAPNFRPLRWLLLSLVLVLAIVSGVASTAFAAWILTDVSSSLLVWALIVIVSLGITRGEELVLNSRFAQFRDRPPSQEAAAGRLVEYVRAHPQEAHTGAPLLYAHSGLTRAGITERFAELSAAGGVGRAARIGTIVLLAATFPHLPAPEVERFADDGFVGCVYAEWFGFFRVAEGHLAVSAVAALALFALMPVFILWTYRRFMSEWRFPAAVQLEVMRRESPGSLLMTPVLTLISIAGTAFWIPVLWASAEVGTRLDSAAAGSTLLVIGVALFLVRARALGRRGTS